MSTSGKHITLRQDDRVLIDDSGRRIDIDTKFVVIGKHKRIGIYKPYYVTPFQTRETAVRERFRTLLECIDNLVLGSVPRLEH